MKTKIIAILAMTLLIATAIQAVGTMNFSINNNIESASASTVVWSDDFDSYAAGSPLHGQGGWEAWDLRTELSPYVSDVQSHSAPNSVELDWTEDPENPSDIVHMFYGINSGIWNIKCWHYLPSDMEGHSGFLIMNKYNHGGPHNIPDDISIALCMHPEGYVHNPMTQNQIPSVTDKWVEISIVIDFDQEIVTSYYNGTMLESISWEGPKNLACLNMYNSDYWSTSSYFDDFSIEGDVSENSDLYCEGELDWTEVVPGDTVTGSFIVQNIGAPSTLLDWEIAETPEWGEWSIEPNSGTDLEGWNPITIDVEIVAPDNADEFTGILKIVNSEDPDDYEIIDVALTTPRGKLLPNTIFHRLLERFSNAFPILRQIFGL